MATLLTLNDISAISAVLPVLAGFVNYRQLDRVLKTAWLFFLVSALFELGLVGAIYLGYSNNMPLIHVFIAISILLFGRIYYLAFSKPLLKKVTLVLATAALLLVLLSIIFIQGIWVFPSVANTVQGVLMIIFSLLYLYQIFVAQEFIHIEKQALFWINSGVLIYFSINLFLFMLFNQFLEQQMQGFYAIHSVTNIIANVLYAIGLLCKPQKIT